MKVKVIAVEDKSFEKDGKTIPGVGLTYEAEGKRETRISWIPTVAPVALSWKPDDEVDIEVYTDKKDRAAFKIPGQGGGGGKGLSYEERARLDEAQSEAMDRRTALMQAVAFHNSAGAQDGTVLQSATKYLAWLREARTPESRQSVGVTKGSGNVEAPHAGTKAGERVEVADTPKPSASGGQTEATHTATGSAGGLSSAGSRRDQSSPAASTSSSAGEDKGHPPVEASEEEPKNRGESGEGSSGEGSSSATLLEQAVGLYGSKPRVLSAARMLHDWHSVDEIDDEDLRALIEKKAPVSA